MGLTRLEKESARDERHGVFLGLAGWEREREREGIESSEGSVKGSLAVNPSKHFSRGWSCTRTFSLSLSLSLSLFPSFFCPYPTSLSLSLMQIQSYLTFLSLKCPHCIHLFFYILMCLRLCHAMHIKHTYMITIKFNHYCLFLSITTVTDIRNIIYYNQHFE